MVEPGRLPGAALRAGYSSFDGGTVAELAERSPTLGTQLLQLVSWATVTKYLKPGDK